jgi:hypothetical protein
VFVGTVTTPSIPRSAALARHHARNNAEAAAVTHNRPYENGWTRYKRWVTQLRNQNSIPVGMKYITRENIDLYFQQQVTLREVQPTTTRRVVSALQKIAIEVECKGTNSLTVENPSVKLALNIHQFILSALIILTGVGLMN